MNDRLKKHIQCIHGSIESSLYIAEELRKKMKTATRTQVTTSLDNICEILSKIKKDSDNIYKMLDVDKN